MNPISFNVAYYLISEYLGLHWQDIVKMGEAEGHAFLKNAMQARFDQNVLKIAAKMEKQGWSYQSRTADRPTPPAAWIADAQYRLWRTFLPGGFFTDKLRDFHHPKIVALIGTLDPGTSTAEMVKWVADAEISLTF